MSKGPVIFSPEDFLRRLASIKISAHILALVAHDKALRLREQNANTHAEVLTERLAEQLRQTKLLQSVCAEAYQMAGAIGAKIQVLDNLSAAAQGKPLPHTTFLPFVPDDSEVISRQRDANEVIPDIIRVCSAYLPKDDGIRRFGVMTWVIEVINLLEDAQLRERPVKLKAITIGDHHLSGICDCGTHSRRSAKFCRECGRRIEWT